MSITVQPILPRFGAEVSGVDITQPLDAATRQAIIDIQNRWGITVWRNTGLVDETHIEFARIFGYLERLPERPSDSKIARHFHRELFSAGNLTAEGEINTAPSAITYRAGDRLWHTDSSFMDLRSAYSLLLAHEVPKVGGATWFADTRSAYDDLPQAMKDRLENLECDHTLWWSRKQGGADITIEQIEERRKSRHKVINTHVSGRKALYLGAHAYQIVGMDWDESRALIDELNAWATQEQYIFSVLYQPGDMVIWDNLCSYHRGGEFDYLNERRDMRRATVREAPEPDQADDPFGALFKEMPAMVRAKAS
jgi:alpha-ketoglutarate-dependent 2,4-dichlorophenoxyacetate dioxygenase